MAIPPVRDQFEEYNKTPGCGVHDPFMKGFMMHLPSVSTGSRLVTAYAL